MIQSLEEFKLVIKRASLLGVCLSLLLDVLTLVLQLLLYVLDLPFQGFSLLSILFLSPLRFLVGIRAYQLVGIICRQLVKDGLLFLTLLLFLKLAIAASLLMG